MKEYGLIVPGQQKKSTITTPAVVTKPNIFDESSDESDDNGPTRKSSRTGLIAKPSLMERRIARTLQEKALAEDPTVFQYDELYDEMEAQRGKEKESKNKEPRKPKYITRLLEYSERRKLENDLRIERQVQKEREAEGEEFKDKESFVTATYRKKLEDMRKMQEQEQRDEYLEAIGDVTKQKDLDGFYRHLYEQKLGTSENVQKPNIVTLNTSAGDGEVSYKPIKSGKPPQKRAYRKRQSTDNEDDDNDKIRTDDIEKKKLHLQNNIDADSDFSIDSSSSSSEDEDDDNEKESKICKQEPKPKELSAVAQTDPNKIALKLDLNTKSDADDIETNKVLTTQTSTNSEETSTPSLPPKQKIDKNEIWKKRTVGEVYEAAVKRYFERRSARNV